MSDCRCAIPGCDHPKRARNLCEAHYRRLIHNKSTAVLIQRRRPKSFERAVLRAIEAALALEGRR